MSETVAPAQSVADLLRLVRADLDAWAAKYKGTTSIASDRYNAVELLSQRPGGLRVVISYAGFKKRGDYEETKAVDHTFKFLITTGRVLTAKPGEATVNPIAGQTPLYELTDRLAARLRAIEFPDGSTEGTLDLTNGDEVTTPEGVFVDAYEITGTLGATQSDED